MPHQHGFTLIELIVVIVILGILAATALPRYVNLSGDAADAAVQGVAGSLTSAASVNYSTCMVRGTSGTGCTRLNDANACVALTSAGAVIGWNSSKYSITADASCATQPAGTVVTCTVTGEQSSTAPATVFCTG